MTRAERLYLQWTAETDERLRVLWRAGVSAKDIAAELGRTPNAILARSSHLILPSRERKTFPYVAPDARWPDGMVFLDDPATEDERDRAPKRVRGDVTAKLMGDPELGQAPPKPRRPTLKLNFPTQRE